MNDAAMLRRLQKRGREKGDCPFLCRLGETACKSKKYLKKRVRTGEFADFLASLFAAYGASLSPDAIGKAIQHSGIRPTDEELCAFPHLLTLLLLREAAARPSSVPACEQLAAALSELDFSAFYEAYSTLDGYLRQKNPREYARLDEPSRRAVRGEIARLAREKHLREADAAELYCRGVTPRRFPVWGYYALLSLTTLLFCSGAVFLLALLLPPAGRTGWTVLLFPLLLFPSGEAARELWQRIAARCLPPRPILRLELTEIPKNAAALTVITCKLNGKDDDRLFSRLETMRRQNRDENLGFGLLCDLCDAPRCRTEEDEGILANAVRQIGVLNEKYGGGFYLFIRRRTPDPDGGWRGWERKRGALLELCRLLTNKEGAKDAFSTVIGDAPAGFAYLLTLDADTDLHIDAVKELLSAALHPENRPVVEDGRVVRGYGILQPRMAVSLDAAGKSPFTVMLCGCGGIEPYETAGFDLPQTLCGRGIYCGKGLFSPAVYLEVLEGKNRFPENRVLSHDLPEGIYLRAGVLGSVTLTDACPRSPAAYRRRAHRWARGDLQNLLFLRRHLSFLEGLWILDGARRLFLPVCRALLLLLSLALPRRAAAFLLPYALLPLFLPFWSAALAYPGRLFRRFYSNVLDGCYHALSLALYRTVTLFADSVISLDAAWRVFWRTNLSRRRLLEWVTASEGERMGLMDLPSFGSLIAGGVILIARWRDPLFLLLGIGTVASPLLSLLLSTPYPDRRDALSLSAERKQTLLRYAADAFGFFEETVTVADHFLPPDNLQLHPERSLAHRTSPTNIGMYLLSLLAVTDMGLLTREKLGEKAEKTVAALEKLPTWKGLLFNWYDTRTLEVPGNPYLSSVDCGNYLASLTAFSCGLREYGFPGLADRVSALEAAGAAGLPALYNERRQLFSIGLDPVTNEQSRGCYDLLMSESRILSYYAVARGIVPKKHWGKLGRLPVGRGGHIGLCSWSGTAFEYFMPALFLPLYPGSLCYEAAGFALFEQVSDRRESLWGKSESGYFAFDADMNYQYRAFGVSGTALSGESRGDAVFAPYAAALALCISTSLPMRELYEMERFGLYGVHGFFEAVDCTPARVGGGHAVIRSYMAHHTGMLLCAVCNRICDGSIRRRFLADGDMAAATELLQEKIPTDIPILPPPKRPRSVPALRQAPPAPRFRPAKTGQPFPETVLCPGKLLLLADTAGAFSLLCGEQLLLAPLWQESVGMECDDGYSLLSGEDLLTEEPAAGICFRRDGSTVRLIPHAEKPLLTVEVALRRRRQLPGTLRFSFTPLLCPQSEERQSPALMRTMLSLAVEKDRAVITRGRRRREDALRTLSILPLGKTVLNGGTLENGRVTLTLSVPEGKAAFVIGYCLRDLPDLRSILRETAASAARQAQRISLEIPATAASEKARAMLLARLAHPFDAPPCERTRASEDALWRFGISGDLPIVCLRMEDAVLSPAAALTVRAFLLAYRRLRREGLSFDLLLLFEGGERYYRPGKAAMEALIDECGCRPFVCRKKGGIYLIAREEGDTAASAFATVILPIGADSIPETLRPIPPAPPALCLPHTRGTAHEPPYSALYATPAFGTMVNERSLGCSWFSNAALLPLSPHPEGERLLLSVGSDRFDLCAIAARVAFLDGYAEWEGEAAGLRFLLRVGVDEKFPVKLLWLRLENRGAPCAVSVEYALLPSSPCRPMGMREEGQTRFYHQPNEFGAGCFTHLSETRFSLAGGEHRAIFGLLGPIRFSLDRSFYATLRRFPDAAAVEEGLRRYGERDRFPVSIRVKSADTALDRLMNEDLPRQILCSRLWGRVGPSQCGGGYGFRDQLQDCVNLSERDPALLRRQLLRAAGSQYYAGDVMHWWHPIPYGGARRGVRTRCSDDLLFLPLAIAAYTDATGDRELLQTALPYLDSPPLGEEEDERYECPSVTDRRESLLLHGLRAIDCALSRRGPHGLPLFGGGDWNDGMNACGGESVCTGMMLLYTIRRYLPLCGDVPRLLAAAGELEAALENCFASGRYARSVDADGTLRGVGERIDLLPQSFAAILGLPHAAEAMDTALRRLYDEKRGILALLSPPYRMDESPYPGYIAAYAPGTRENGGQYTHAALFAVWGLYRLGQAEKAFTVLRRLLPDRAAEDPAYGGEPYVIAADRSTAPGSYGKCGWTHYTGSAGWAYRLLLREEYGYRAKNGGFTLSPARKTPFTLSVVQGGTRYRVTAAAEWKRYFLDGNELSPDTIFRFDGKTHRIDLR